MLKSSRNPMGQGNFAHATSQEEPAFASDAGAFQPFNFSCQIFRGCSYSSMLIESVRPRGPGRPAGGNSSAKIASADLIIML